MGFLCHRERKVAFPQGGTLNQVVFPNDVSKSSQGTALTIFFFTKTGMQVNMRTSSTKIIKIFHSTLKEDASDVWKIHMHLVVMLNQSNYQIPVVWEACSRCLGNMMSLKACFLSS